MKKVLFNKGSSPRNVVGDLPHIKSFVNKESSLFNKAKSAGDCRQRHSAMTTFFNEKAFTLIELLVVVLIIGILSAIALPKYQVAVAKAKFANLQTVARTYARAAEVVRLETGSWPRSFDVLAVDPGNGSSFSSANLADDTCASNNEMYCCLLGGVSGQQYESVVCGTLDYSLAYFWEPQNKRNVCFAKANTYLDQVCKSLGGTENNAAGNNLVVPGGFRSGYNRYHF